MTNTGQPQENKKIQQSVPAVDEEIVAREEPAANELSAVEETLEEEVCAASENLSAVEEIVVTEEIPLEDLSLANEESAADEELLMEKVAMIVEAALNEKSGLQDDRAGGEEPLEESGEDPEPLEPPGEKRFHLTVIQKWLMAICVVLAVSVLGVVGCRSMFVEPELPSVDDKKPPAFGTDIPGSSGEQEPPSDEIVEDNGLVPKMSGERKSDKYYTILILGRDTGGGGQTDTMLLASYDVTNQKATVMSIPRDTMVNVSWDNKKINTVYNMYGKGNKGLQAVYKEISQLVGFEPDYEVVVEWEAVGAMVDAIGGVWFDVPYTMDYHDPYQDLVIEQEKGYRLLNGEDAMQVIRWRKNDQDSPHGYHGGIGDSGRMKMQQNFLKAVIQQLLKPENVTRIDDIANVFKTNVQTSLDFGNILWFGMQAVRGGLGVEDVTFVTMPYAYADVYSRNLTERQGSYSTLAYVVPRGEELLKLVNESLNPYKEDFTLENMDIMYVNADGSIGSTTGQVADQEAALPPPKPPVKEASTPAATLG